MEENGSCSGQIILETGIINPISILLYLNPRKKIKNQPLKVDFLKRIHISLVIIIFSLIY